MQPKVGCIRSWGLKDDDAHQPEWQGRRARTPPRHDWRAHSIGCGAAIETDRGKHALVTLCIGGAGLRSGDSQRVGILIYSFRGMVPVVQLRLCILRPPSSGVTVGEDCYVGPMPCCGIGENVMNRGVNVQEGCVLHMFPGTTVLLEETPTLDTVR